MMLRSGQLFFHLKEHQTRLRGGVIFKTSLIHMGPQFEIYLIIFKQC